MTKRFITAISVACVLFLCFSVTASAKTDKNNLLDDYEDQLVSQLDFLSRDIENSKLSDIDFRELYIGNPISVYEYLDSGLQEAYFSLLPIFYSGKLVFMATLVHDENGNRVQLSDCFIDKLTRYCDTAAEIAIIYDAQKCYLVMRESISELYTFNYEVSQRSLLPTQDVFSLLDEKKIVFSELKALHKIKYTPSYILRSTAFVNVQWVSQNPPSNICWAASVACIGNFLTSYSYTALDIAKYVYGPTSWNQGASNSVALDALFNKYGVSYSHYASYIAPSDSRLFNNINGGYPVFGRWSWTSGYHANVIKGVSTGSQVLVMDPEYGFDVASKSSGVYSYISGYSGVTLTLVGYGSKL